MELLKPLTLWLLFRKLGLALLHPRGHERIQTQLIWNVDRDIYEPWNRGSALLSVVVESQTPTYPASSEPN